MSQSVEIICLLIHWNCSKFPENGPDVSTHFQCKHSGWVANAVATFSNRSSENPKVYHILCDFHICLPCMRLKDIKIETQFTVLFGYTWFGEWPWSGLDVRCSPKKHRCCHAKGTINSRQKEFLHSLQQNLEGSIVNSTNHPAALCHVLSPSLKVLRVTSHLSKSK